MNLREAVAKIIIGQGEQPNQREVLPFQHVEYAIHHKTCTPLLKGFRWQGYFVEVDRAEMNRISENIIQYFVPFTNPEGHFVIQFDQELLEWTLLGFQLGE